MALADLSEDWTKSNRVATSFYQAAGGGDAANFVQDLADLPAHGFPFLPY